MCECKTCRGTGKIETPNIPNVCDICLGTKIVKGKNNNPELCICVDGTLKGTLTGLRKLLQRAWEQRDQYWQILNDI